MSSVQFVKDISLPSTWGSVPLSDFFRSLRWEQQSAADLKQAAKAGDWEALKTALLPEVLASRDDLSPTLPVDEWPWAWSVNGEHPSSAAEAVLATLRKLTSSARANLATPVPSSGTKPGKKSKTADRWEEIVRTWLEVQNCAPCSAIDRLVWLDLFPLLAPQLNGELFCSLWKKLFIEAAIVSAEILSTKGKQRPSLLTQELAWRFSLLFWSVLGGDRIQALSSAMLEQTLLDETDELGTPSGESLVNLSIWLAPFVRAAKEAQRAGVTLFEETGQKRFRRLTHRALAISSDTGEFLLSRTTPANPQGFLKQLLSAGDESVADFLLSAFPALKASGNRRDSSKSERGSRKPGALPAVLGEEPDVSPRASFQSDALRVACLRNYASKAEGKFVVAHHTPNPLIDLNTAGVSFLKGAWTSSILRGKKSLTAVQPWANTCWNCDEDSEYFEMQLELPGGGQLDRQILIPRKGHYAILTESVSKLPAGRLEHEMRIPLGPGLKVEQDQKTREYRLTGNGRVARLFPLTFPQSKIDSTSGSLTLEGNELVLRSVSEGTGLYVPIVLDWDSGRTHASAIWKALTVTENLQKVPGDVAAGYRLKLNQQHQLLIYRSLQNSWEPRSCLGFQTRYETAIGRVNTNGDLLPLMYVE